MCLHYAHLLYLYRSMKQLKSHIVGLLGVFLLLAFATASFAQSTTPEVVLEQLASQESLIAPTLEQNSVFIDQIGIDNIANVTSFGSNSLFSLSQNGLGNTADFLLYGNNVQMLVSQTGNDNNYKDYIAGAGAGDKATFTLVQNGNNLNFERFDMSGNVKDLKVTMTGNNRTVIVRGF